MHIALDDSLQRVLCDFQVVAGLRVQQKRALVLK